MLHSLRLENREGDCFQDMLGFVHVVWDIMGEDDGHEHKTGDWHGTFTQHFPEKNKTERLHNIAFQQYCSSTVLCLGLLHRLDISGTSPEEAQR